VLVFPLILSETEILTLLVEKARVSEVLLFLLPLFILAESVNVFFFLSAWWRSLHGAALKMFLL